MLIKRNTDQVKTAEKPGILQRIRSIIASAWNPQPLEKPAVDENLDEYGFLRRSVEILKYNTLRIEYALSSGGWLRNWLRINLFIGAVLAISAILVLPPLVAVMAGLASIVTSIMLAIKNLTLAVIWLLVLLFLVKVLTAAAEDSRRDDSWDREPYDRGRRRRGPP